MADDADIANNFISNAIEAALSQRQANTNQNAADIKFCEECEEEIPLARRELGFKLCITCAEAVERRSSLFST